MSSRLVRMPVQCPSCQGALAVTKLACTECSTELDGRFEPHPLLRLTADDLAFVLAFVRASGSLKAMAQLLGLSYPTVRNRLDAIIDALGKKEPPARDRERGIVDAVARGELSVRDAIRRLREIRR